MFLNTNKIHDQSKILVQILLQQGVILFFLYYHIYDNSYLTIVY